MPSVQDLLSLWYAGLNSPHGLAIKTDNRVGLRADLYEAREGYEELGKQYLVILFPQDESELWIVRKNG